MMKPSELWICLQGGGAAGTGGWSDCWL